VLFRLISGAYLEYQVFGEDAEEDVEFSEVEESDDDEEMSDGDAEEDHEDEVNRETDEDMSDDGMLHERELAEEDRDDEEQLCGCCDVEPAEVLTLLPAVSARHRGYQANYKTAGVGLRVSKKQLDETYHDPNDPNYNLRLDPDVGP